MTTRWRVLAGVMVATVAPALNLYKVPPLIPVLTADFGVATADVGWLMSIYALAGLLVSLPAAWVVRHFHLRGTIAIGGAICLVGTTLGALSPTFAILLLSRFIEGIGLGLLTVPAIMLLGLWFPPEQRGLASGVFSMWLPLGSTAMLNVAPFVHEHFGGWRAVWWLGVLIMLVSIPLAWWLVRELAPAAVAANSERGSRWLMLRVALRSPAVLLAVAFALFHASRQALITWIPAFLVGRGLTLGEAAGLSSIATLTTIPLCLVAGGAIALLRSAKAVYVLGLLAGAPLMVLIFLVPVPWLAPLLVLSGIAAALVPTAVNAAAPETRPRNGSPGLAVATVAVGRNGGMLLGPFAIGTLLQASNMDWPLVAWTLGAASLVGALFAWLVPARARG